MAGSSGLCVWSAGRFSPAEQLIQPHGLQLAVPSPGKLVINLPSVPGAHWVTWHRAGVTPAPGPALQGAVHPAQLGALTSLHASAKGSTSLL